MIIFKKTIKYVRGNIVQQDIVLMKGSSSNGIYRRNRNRVCMDDLPLNCDCSRVELTPQLRCNVLQCPTFGIATENKLNCLKNEYNKITLIVSLIWVTIAKLEILFCVQSMMGFEESIYTILIIAKVENIYPTGLFISKFQQCSVTEKNY